jgi:hypothetical protein
MFFLFSLRLSIKINKYILINRLKFMGLNPAFFEGTSDPKKKNNKINTNDIKQEFASKDPQTFNTDEVLKLIKQAINDGYKQSQNFDRELAKYSKKFTNFFQGLLNSLVYIPNLFFKLIPRIIILIFQLLILIYRLLRLFILKGTKNQLSFRRKVYYLKLNLAELKTQYIFNIKHIVKTFSNFCRVPFYFFQTMLRFPHKNWNLPFIPVKLMINILQLATLVGIANYCFNKRKKFIFLKKLILQK